MTLSILLLGEVIVLLLFLLMLAVLNIRKQKKLLQKQWETLQQIKSLYEQRVNEYEGSLEQHKSQAGDTGLREYFASNLRDSQARYEKYTQAKLPKIDPNQALSAKVAALRFIYLTAEKEVYDERGVTHAGWNLFERKLADIIRWFGKSGASRQEVRSNRTRLLQERIDALKPFEEQAKTLQRRLEQSQRKQKQLEAYQRESRETINNLQKMIATLRTVGNTEAVQSPTPDPHQDIGHIANTASKNSHAFRNLMEEFNIYRPGMPPEIHQKMENSIRIMEIELVKSDRYIANLRKQLNEAKSQVAIAASSAPSASNEVPSPRDYVDRHKAMAEIHQLRENNHVQRGLIVKLENEINALRQSLTTVEDEETRKAKEIEVARLERLVKDCQNCIETLEGQVDNLYAQLRERESDQPPTAEMQEEGDDLNASEASGLAEMASSTEALEAMAGEMENIIFQYRQSHALNRFAQELSQHQELDSIATAVMQFLAEFQAEAGLCLRSHLEVKKYFPEGRFNEQQRQLTCSFAVKDPVFYINETTLFSSERINLMLLPTIDARPPHESVVQGLVKIVDAYIGLLEAGKLGSVTEQKMDAWVEATKNQLADLDIQYAYQLEENKKAFNQFMTELRHSYHLLDLKGSGLVLLDNAINEYEQRMYLIMDSGDIIDREITKIVDNIDRWQQQ